MPLKPGSTAAIVFWSKNFRPFFNKLDRLERMGFQRFIFNFTITGMPKAFEPNVPPVEETVSDFFELSRRYGEKAVLWRFDPILFSNITDEDYYIKRFTELAGKIAPFTKRCIFSFAFFYNKVKRSLEALDKQEGVRAFNVDIQRKREMAERLAEIAASHGLEFQACCCEYLENVPGVKGAHCVDGELVSEMLGGEYSFKLKPSRAGCGCAESSDIGEYGSCKGGCAYCYAR